MAEEQKTIPSGNAAAEQDVQNVLADLKGENSAPANGEAEKKKEEAPADADEARIVAAAAQLGEKSEKAEEQKEQDAKSREQRGRGAGRNQARFDPSSQQETDDPVEIRKQVEFYFSDSNLPMDKFLLSQVGGSANRPVALELLCSFKRMRRFQPRSAIVAALRDSAAVELTDNDTAVRRKTPLPETVKEAHDPGVAKVFEDKAMGRSVYAKGFGEEGPTTQLDIEAFFAPYGPTNAIRLRRTHDKLFKGSVFVEFASEEKQQAFLALDPKPQWQGKDLLIKSKKEYCEEKVKEIEAGRVRPNGGRGRGRGRGGRGHGRGRGGRNGGDWRQRRTEDQQKDSQSERRDVQKDSRGVPVVQSTTDSAESGQKRSRDDESAAQPPAKKVDAKE